MSKESFYKLLKKKQSQDFKAYYKKVKKIYSLLSFLLQRHFYHLFLPVILNRKYLL